jgi:hypothetical protein
MTTYYSSHFKKKMVGDLAVFVDEHDGHYHTETIPIDLCPPDKMNRRHHRLYKGLTRDVAELIVTMTEGQPIDEGRITCIDGMLTRDDNPRMTSVLPINDI